MATERKDIVYSLRIDQGPALRQFEELNRALQDQRAIRTQLNREVRDNIKQTAALEKAIRDQGSATDAQTAALGRLRERREELNRQQAASVIQEKALSAQTRELTNDLSGLTAAGLRFRDKMADAFTEALEGSQIFQQLANRAGFLTSELEETNKALEAQRARIQQAREQFDAGATSEEEYARAVEQATQEVDQLTDKQSGLQTELQQTEQANERLSVEVKALTLAYQKGEITQDAFRKGLRDLEREAVQTGAAFKDQDWFRQFRENELSVGALKQNLSGLAAQYIGVGVAVAGVASVFGNAARTVVEFDQALAGVRALGGEYRANIDALGDAAIRLGPKFGKGASESLKAIEALAKAGVSAADILSGGLEGALALSAAGSLEVGQAAEVAASALTQFGLSGSDVNTVADLLAAGANKAQGEVSDLAAALQQSGLVAAQLDIPLEDTVGTLSAFAANGLLGSDAGTSFKTMLQSLVPRSKEAAETMAQLGIEFFDAQGNFVGLEGAADELRTGLEGLSQEQQTAALRTIFGSDAVRAATVLYKEGAEGVRGWIDQVNQQGFAAQVAGDRLESLTGKGQRFKAAWEGLVLSIENGGGVIGRAIGFVLDRFTQFFDNVAFFEAKAAGLTTVAAQFEKLIASDQREQIDNLDQLIELTERRVRVIRETKDTEEDLVLLQQQRKDNLTEINQLEAQYGSLLPAQVGRLASLKVENEALNAEIKRRGGLLTENVVEFGKVEQAGTKAAGEIATELDKTETATKGVDATVKLVAGSIADLNRQIEALRTQQNDATTSAQFATYQRQIDDLEESIRRIREGESLTPMIDEVFGRNPEALPPLELADPGTPMIDDLEAESARRLQSLREEARLLELQGIQDFNLERMILEEEYAAGIITSREELNARIAQLSQEQFQYDLGQAEQVLGSFRTVADGYLAIQQAQTDNQIAEIDKRIEAAEEAGQSTELLEKEKRRILEENAKEAFETNRALAIAQLAIDTAKAISGAVAASTAGDPYTMVARIALAVGSVLAAIAQATAKVPSGFAEGGEIREDSPSGVVRPGWGRRIRRSNGDDVLVRAGSGHVTLKTGEIVLNKRQQRRAEAIGGRGIWGAIGVPGFARAQLAAAQHMRDAFTGIPGFAGGGLTTRGVAMVNASGPRPDPSDLNTIALAAIMRDMSDQRIVLPIEHLNEVSDRATLTRNIATVTE